MLPIKKIRPLVLLGFGLALGSVQASGIPTVDIAALAQRVTQIQQMVQQLETMKNQYTQEVNQYKALVGNRGFGNLLNNAGIEGMLPDISTLYTNVTPNQQRFADEIINDANRSTDEIAEDSRNQAASDAAWAETSYAATVKRVQVIQGLASAINKTSDPKDIAELNARIQIEQASIQNENNRMQLLAARAQAEREKLQAKLDAQAHKEFNPANTGVPSLLD